METYRITAVGRGLTVLTCLWASVLLSSAPTQSHSLVDSGWNDIAAGCEVGLGRDSAAKGGERHGEGGEEHFCGRVGVVKV